MGGRARRQPKPQAAGPGGGPVGGSPCAEGQRGGGQRCNRRVRDTYPEGQGDEGEGEGKGEIEKGGPGAREDFARGGESQAQGCKGEGGARQEVLSLARRVELMGL